MSVEKRLGGRPAYSPLHPSPRWDRRQLEHTVRTTLPPAGTRLLRHTAGAIPDVETHLYQKNPWPRQDPLGLCVVSVFLVGHPHVRIRERERLNIAVTMQDVGFPTRQMSVALLLVSSNECVALSVVIFERVVIV